MNDFDANEVVASAGCRDKYGNVDIGVAAVALAIYCGNHNPQGMILGEYLGDLTMNPIFDWKEISASIVKKACAVWNTQMQFVVVLQSDVTKHTEQVCGDSSLADIAQAIAVMVQKEEEAEARALAKVKSLCKTS